MFGWRKKGRSKGMTEEQTSEQADEIPAKGPFCTLNGRGDDPRGRESPPEEGSEEKESGATGLNEALQAAQTAVREKQEAHLRLLAEMENLRKRTAREMEQARQYAIEGFARDLLSVADNLERALSSLNPDSEGASSVQAVMQGVGLVQGELKRVFEKNGLTRVDPLAAPFDPHFHQAMMEMENGEAKPGTVVLVMQPGYLLNGRLIRPALVGVAKAPTQVNDTMGA